MTDTEILSPSPTASSRPSATRRRRLRLAGIGATLAVTLAVWTVGRLAGADYVLRDPSGVVVIDAVATAVVTLVVSLLGWAVLAVLERLTRHAAGIWVGLAAGAVVASMIPIFLVDATPTTQVWLYLVHIAVAVLVPALLRART
jgi:uncharacterized membrane protein